MRFLVIRFKEGEAGTSLDSVGFISLFPSSYPSLDLWVLKNIDKG